MDLKTLEKSQTRKAYHVIPRPLRRKARRAWLEMRNHDAAENALPDFYIIGTMKSGTTSLFMHLEEHPEIVASRRKEVHYFNTDRDMGRNYFRSFFPKKEALGACGNAYGRQITGEATPDYSFHPAAAGLCRALTPNARLVMIMRDPVERAFSHWKQGRRFGFESEPFEEALALEEARLEGEAERLMADPHYYSYRHQLLSYKSRGHYAEQITRWLRHFPREQFLFIPSERMFTNGLQVFREVTDFLGLSRWEPAEFSVKFPGMKGEIPEDSRRALAAHFRPHNEALFSIVGEDYDWQH